MTIHDIKARLILLTCYITWPKLLTNDNEIRFSKQTWMFLVMADSYFMYATDQTLTRIEFTTFCTAADLISCFFFCHIRNKRIVLLTRSSAITPQHTVVAISMIWPGGSLSFRRREDINGYAISECYWGDSQPHDNHQTPHEKPEPEGQSTYEQQDCAERRDKGNGVGTKEISIWSGMIISHYCFPCFM